MFFWDMTFASPLERFPTFRDHYFVSKSREPIAQWCSVISQQHAVTQRHIPAARSDAASYPRRTQHQSTLFQKTKTKKLAFFFSINTKLCDILQFL